MKITKKLCDENFRFFGRCVLLLVIAISMCVLSWKNFSENSDGQAKRAEQIRSQTSGSVAGTDVIENLTELSDREPPMQDHQIYDDNYYLEIVMESYRPAIPRLSGNMPDEHLLEMQDGLMPIKRPEFGGGKVKVEKYEGPNDAFSLLIDFVGWVTPDSQRSYFDDGEYVFVWRGNSDTETQGYAVRKDDLTLYKWVLDNGVEGLAGSDSDRGYWIESATEGRSR